MKKILYFYKYYCYLDIFLNIKNIKYFFIIGFVLVNIIIRLEIEVVDFGFYFF